jgi:hypothetical protein
LLAEIEWIVRFAELNGSEFHRLEAVDEVDGTFVALDPHRDAMRNEIRNATGRWQDLVRAQDRIVVQVTLRSG